MTTLTRCQCPGARNWPGHCPGPAACPCCATPSEICDDCESTLEPDGTCKHCLMVAAENKEWEAAQAVAEAIEAEARK